MRENVLAIGPGFINPFTESTAIEITGRHAGRSASAPGFGSHGEPVRCVRGRTGKITELWLAGSKLLPAGKLAREMEARYGKKPARKRRHQ